MLRLLTRYAHLSLAEEVERPLHDLTWRWTEALAYLTQHAHVDPLERIESWRVHRFFAARIDGRFSRAAGSHTKREAARAIVSAMVGEKGEAGRRTRLEAAQLLAAVPDIFDQELRKLLDDNDSEVVGPPFVPQAAQAKSHSTRGEAVRTAGMTSVAVAVFAGMGDTVAGTLRDHLVDPDTPVEVRREIPAVLQAIGTPAAQFVLVESAR